METKILVLTGARDYAYPVPSNCVDPDYKWVESGMAWGVLHLCWDFENHPGVEAPGSSPSFSAGLHPVLRGWRPRGPVSFLMPTAFGLAPTIRKIWERWAGVGYFSHTTLSYWDGIVEDQGAGEVYYGPRGADAQYGGNCSLGTRGWTPPFPREKCGPKIHWKQP